MSKIRYYCHGDQNEIDQAEYYCACCDSFELEDHFQQHDDQTHLRTLNHTKERWREAYRDTFRRPPDPTNLFN
jgi:hypothetical protein